jgi:hypothetical protein
VLPRPASSSPAGLSAQPPRVVPAHLHADSHIRSCRPPSSPPSSSAALRRPPRRFPRFSLDCLLRHAEVPALPTIAPRAARQWRARPPPGKAPSACTAGSAGASTQPRGPGVATPGKVWRPWAPSARRAVGGVPFGVPEAGPSAEGARGRPRGGAASWRGRARVIQEPLPLHLAPHPRAAPQPAHEGTPRHSAGRRERGRPPARARLLAAPRGA